MVLISGESTKTDPTGGFAATIPYHAEGELLFLKFAFTM